MGWKTLANRAVRTTIIPKKELGYFRSITIGSVLARITLRDPGQKKFWKLKLYSRPRGFQASDSSVDNAILLDMILNWQLLMWVRPLTPSHTRPSFRTLSYGFQTNFTSHIQQCYEDSHTTISGDWWSSKAIAPKRGVKQGGSLSHIFFNLVLDILIISFPEEN